MIQNFKAQFYIFLFPAVFDLLLKNLLKGFDIIPKIWYNI